MLNLAAHIFPAFVLKYTGKELNILERNGFDFNSRLLECERLLNINFTGFDLKSNSFIDQEYRNQILSYLFATSFSDVLKSKDYQAACVSGFSMGIYSAFYHANIISFESGLHLITDVFHLIKKVMSGRSYKMASVIGFEHKELMKYLSSHSSLEPVIKNGVYSFVVAGEESELNSLLSQLEKEGAIHLSLFSVNFSYHSKVLGEYKPLFEKLLSNYSFSDAQVKYISMVDQTTIQSGHDLEKEIVRNIVEPLDFYQTIQQLIKLGHNNIIEVGADTSLLKSSKFIDGEFDFKAIAKGRII